MRAAPGGRRLAVVGPRTQYGSQQTLWVIRRLGGWLGVVSPEAGNGRLGWIAANAASLARIDWELRVSLSRRQLTVLQDGLVQQRYRIAIGSPAAPTPTGRFAVTDRLTTGDPGGPYGCCILALSARSPHAIHSTPEVSSLGKPASHGCVRVGLPQGRWLLDHIPLGTPTLIGG